MRDEKTNENFGRDDRNFHPEEQRINWEIMSNRDPIEEQQQFASDTENDLENNSYSDKREWDNAEPNVKEQPIQPELDRDLDEELDKELEDYSDEDVDQKDKSDS